MAQLLAIVWILPRQAHGATELQRALGSYNDKGPVISGVRGGFTLRVPIRASVIGACCKASSIDLRSGRFVVRDQLGSPSVLGQAVSSNS